MHIIGFLIFGLIVGLLARAIYPGRQNMGWLSTAVLGMIGSLVGGLIGHAIWGGNSAADGQFGVVSVMSIVTMRSSSMPTL